MRALCISLLVAFLSVPAIASPAERRPRDQDDCARKSAACEAQCESLSGADRLSCKTDCRLAEIQCRSGRR